MPLTGGLPVAVDFIADRSEMDIPRSDKHTEAWAELRIHPGDGFRILSATGLDAIGVAQSDSIVGSSLLCRVHEADHDVLAPLASARAGEFNLRMRDAEGHVRCLCGRFLRDGDQGEVRLRLADARTLFGAHDRPLIGQELRALLENTDDYIYFKNQHHVLTACSRSLARAIGREDQWESLPGSSDYDLFGEIFADAYYALEKNVYAGMPVARDVQAFRDEHGHERWADNRKYPIHDASGAIVGLFGVARDVTDMRQTAEALRETSELLRMVIDEIPDPLLLKDEKGDFLLCNRAVARLYDTTPEEMVGRHDDDFGVPAEIADEFRRNVLEIMASGQTRIVFEDSRDAVTGRIRHYRSIKKPFKDAEDNNRVLVLAQEVTDIIEAQQRVIESERRLQTVLEVTREGVWDWHIPSGRTEHNRQWYASLGYEEGEVERTVSAFYQILHPDDRDRVAERVEALASGRADYYRSEHRMLRKDGTVIWVQDRGRVAERDSEGQPLRLVGSFIDVTLQREQKRQLEFLAHYDALTGLPNRVLLADRMKQAMLHVQRRGGRLVVAYLDLDGFKQINDRHGHGAGDQLLRSVANQLKATLREGDTIARLGGDEFVAVLTDLNDEISSIPLVTRLLDAVSRPIMLRDEALVVSGSVGVTFYPQGEEVDADQMLRQADQAMYQAKLAGKNRYHFFDAEEDRSVRGRHEHLQRLERALTEREFLLYYQPKVDLRAGTVFGVEALIRWRHPERGILGPAEFLPELEREALGVRLGEWVIDEACKQLAVWLGQGVDLNVSVNVSAYHLQQPDFIARMRQRLARCDGVAAGRLEIEVLETSALDDLDRVRELFEACAELGVRIALDDFGTGYSSLTYLRRLPAQVLKIDRSFVAGMLDDPDDLAILEGTIGLGRAFRRDIVAEGVETLEQGAMLLLLGCQLAQGYAIARPMPAESLLPWLDEWTPAGEWMGRGCVRSEMLPAIYACVDIRSRLLQLERYLGGSSCDPPALDLAGCRLGRWLELVRDRFSNEPKFSLLESTYGELLGCVGAGVALDRAGGDCSAVLDRLRSLRERMTSQLMDLLHRAGAAI